MSMAIPAPVTPAPTARRIPEWHLLQTVYLAVAAVVLFIVTFWSALGQPPLGGTIIEWVLAFVLVSLVNLGLGTLGGGAVIEWRHLERGAATSSSASRCSCSRARRRRLRLVVVLLDPGGVLPLGLPHHRAGRHRARRLVGVAPAARAVPPAHPRRTPAEEALAAPR